MDSAPDAGQNKPSPDQPEEPSPAETVPASDAESASEAESEAEPVTKPLPLDETPATGSAPATQPDASPQRITILYLGRNVVSLMGLAGVALFGLILFFLILVDLLGMVDDENPYRAMITWIGLPVLVTASFFFMLLGMTWRWWRTRKSGVKYAMIPGRTPQRRYAVVAAAVMITLTWVFLTSIGTYKAYHFSDSNQFCGKACHQVMEPEYVAYHHSPHSRVDCVACHIGPGADYYAKAKYRGMMQLWKAYHHEYETPIKTPIDSIRRAKETCGQCHWPDRQIGNVERVFTHYASDEDNTMIRYHLLIKVGGGPEKTHGAHWHASEEVEVKYLALDEKRQEIPFVRVTHRDGRTEEFMTEGFDRSKIVESELRTMDCLDCHNRPAHRFEPPNRLLNKAMAEGRISDKLPGIKRTLLKALSAEYATRQEALTAFDKTLDEYAAEKKLGPELVDALVNARKSIKEIYNTQFFPEHKVDYRAFINNMGHFEYQGCERCHDNKHFYVNNKEKVISHDCNACHTIVAQKVDEDEPLPLQYKLSKFQHPEDPVNLKRTCSSCHALNKKKGPADEDEE